jgi:hypothetical protein
MSGKSLLIGAIVAAAAIVGATAYLTTAENETGPSIHTSPPATQPQQPPASSPPPSPPAPAEPQSTQPPTQPRT